MPPLHHWSSVLRHSATLLACAFSAVALSAQAPAHTFRAFVVNRGGAIKDLCYDYQRSRHTLAADGLTFSRPYPIPSGGLVSFYRETPGTGRDGKPARIAVADVSFGPRGEWLLFLFVGKSREEIKTLVVDQSWDKHPAETIRVFNFCAAPVAFHIAGVTRRVPPGRFEQLAYPAAGSLNDDGMVWAKVAALVGDGRWLLRANTPISIRPGTRSTWLAFDAPFDPLKDSPDDRRVIVRSLVDSAPATP